MWYGKAGEAAGDNRKGTCYTKSVYRSNLRHAIKPTQRAQDEDEEEGEHMEWEVIGASLATCAT